MQQHKTDVFQRFQKCLQTLAEALWEPSERCVRLSEVLGELTGNALGPLVGTSWVLGAPSGRHRDVIGAVLGVLRVIWKSSKSLYFLHNFSNLGSLRMPQDLL